MILKNLRLINYRKFRDITIEFPDGVTGIIGLNGVGKSTIFEAVSWVLYGPAGARTTSDQIKSYNATKSEPCRVELEFIFEDIKYRVFREITGKYQITTARITANGKIAATSADAVNKYIKKKIGMDYKSFFTSIYAKQKELNALSTMIASERRPLILKMLGIDSLDDVIKEIKSDKKERGLIIEKLKQDTIDENGKDKIEKYKFQINTIEKEKKYNDIINKKIQEKIIVLKKSFDKLEKKVQTIKKQYEKYKDLKEKLFKKKNLFEEKEKLQNEIKNLKNKIIDRKKLIQFYKKKLYTFVDLDVTIKSSEKKIDELHKKFEDLIRQIEQKNTLIKKVKQDLTEIENKKNKIKKIGPNAKCPTCERVLAEQYTNLISKFNDEIKKNEKEIKIFLNELKTAEIDKDKLTRENLAFQKKKSYLQNQMREKEKIETIIESIKIELKREQIEFKIKEGKLNELNKVEFDINEFNNISNKVEVQYIKYQNTLTLKDKKKDEIYSNKINLERKESEKNLILQKLNNLKEKITEIEKYKKKIKKEKITFRQLEILNDIMSNFRTHLISRIRPTLSNYSSDFFDRLTDGKYKQLELDENYNIIIFDNGNPFGIERFSGGEEDLANLCLRLAISEVITERSGGVFNFIILDEIFGSQDIYRRQNIMKALNALSSKFRQIFLITHLDDLKNDMDNIIFVTENENGISTTIIE